MNYKETGFRPFYHHFTVVPITKKTKPTIVDFPGAETANGILTYGYYDREAGLSLEVLGLAHVEEDRVWFEESSKEVRATIRIGAVAEDKFMFFADEDGALAERYAEKIADLHKFFGAEDKVEETRKMSFLDGCRHEFYIDDILVYLVKEGLKPEGCWVRIVGLGDHCFIGRLLNEPDQAFGYHEGEKIAFFAHKNEKEEIMCISDMNPSAKITEEDLEDGSMLEAAITAFNNEKNEEHLLDILEILRDSYVWIPCNTIMSEEDQARIEAMVKANKDNLDALKGVEFVTNDATRLVPDILQNGDAFFFPVFSTPEAMGDYGNNFSKVQKHMLEAITLAKHNERELAGIVVNAFSEPYVFDRELWDMVEKKKSRI